MQTAGYTIGSHGCCLTSFAMVTNYYGSQDNPGHVNTKLGDAACPLNWSTAKTKYGLNYTNLSNENGIDEAYGKTYILGALRQNRPVIVCLKKSNGNTHFVVVYEYMRARYDENSPVQEFFFIMTLLTTETTKI